MLGPPGNGEPAAPLSTRFTDYTLAQEPSDWTKRWSASGNWTLVRNFGSGAALRQTGTGVGAAAISWDEIGETDDTIEILVLTSAEVGGVTGRDYMGVVVRGSGAEESETGYEVVIRKAATDTLRLRKNVDGSTTLLANPSLPSGNHIAFRTHFIRMRVETVGGDVRIRVKEWLYHQEEPSAWEIDVTDSSSPILSGWAGATTWNESNYDRFAYALGGETAVMDPEPQQTFATDFSEYDLETFPADFSWPFVEATSAEIVADAAALGGQILRIDEASAARTFPAWDTVGVAEDVEVLAKVRSDSTGASDVQVGATARMSGGAAGEWGHFSALRAGDVFQHSYYRAGTSVGVTGPAFTWSADTWYWIRQRIGPGGRIRVKRWADGDSEPGSWNIDTTPSESRVPVSGLAGIFSFDGNQHDIDYLAVATGGATAPGPS